MFVSYVVRLRAPELARGSFAGEIEGVATGHRYKVSSLEQVAAFITQTFPEEQSAARNAVEQFDESSVPPF